MAKAGLANLRVPSSEEARRNGAKGGKASAKARRERKAMQQVVRDVLSTPMRPGDLDTIDTIEGFVEGDLNLTVEQMALLAIAAKAAKGDVKSMEFLRDTAGERPKEEIEVSAPIMEAAADIAAAIERMKENDG